MSTINLENLLKDPTILFAQQTTEALNCDELLGSLKDIIDPVIKESEGCVLDEIFIDGLDASQVWGQVKLVNENVERSVWADIEEFKAKGLYNEKTGDEDVDSDSEEIENDSEEAFGEMNQEDEGSEEEEVEGEEMDDDEEEDEVMEEDDEEVEAEQDENDNEEEDEEVVVEGGRGKDDFGLNDEVFNLDDYKRQVLALEDGEEFEEDGEDVDLFADFSEEEEEEDEMYTYNDFFDPNDASKGRDNRGSRNGQFDRFSKKGKKNDENEEGEMNEDEYDAAYSQMQADLYGDEEEEEEIKSASKGKQNNVEVDESKLSTFEKQQREIAKQIAELEAESIAEKKWTMKGEVSGKQRKADTLLGEELEFDRTAKPVPVITQETTETIEELIKRRIENQEFDEVQKRIISEMNNFRKSKKVEVSEEKSGKSLAELYEDEYNGSEEKKEEIHGELKTAHDEISGLFKDITYQLDSLYSSHFVPKPKEKLLDIRIETSTIAMEDAQPLTMATGTSMAPQEIYKIQTKVNKDEVVLKSGVVMAKAELERDDRQRLHRAKKRKQHLASKDDSLKKKKVESNQL